jgi:shikimate dehydrogenase
MMPDDPLKEKERIAIAQTDRAFVIGHPIGHSRSPILHGHWLRRYGKLGQYEAIDVAPGDLPSFIAAMRQNGFVGGNVTIPHKEAVTKLVSRMDSDAQQIGAVNTLWFEADELIGGNTDGYGFLANLDDESPGWGDDPDARTALILGAGGAARAVMMALASRRISRIIICNRTQDRADTLCAHGQTFHSGLSFQACPWNDRNTILSQIDVLVNTTSLGMTGHPPLLLQYDALRSTAVVNDLVYTPLETELLFHARQAGLQAVDGLGMLLHQAAPGFERWFGVKPQVDAALREAVLPA